MTVKDFHAAGQDPIGKQEKKQSDFDAVECYRSTCKSADNSLTSTWKLGYDEPCARWCNCNGPLCSSCKPGFKRTMSSQV